MAGIGRTRLSGKTSQLAVSASSAEAAALLVVDGVLDSSTYLKLRDAIIGKALDERRAVLIDVTGLRVPASSAWSAFTSARWHVEAWPGVPILLVCRESEKRVAITRTGVTRYVPVYSSVEAALDAISGDYRSRRRIETELPGTIASLRRTRQLVAECLAEWSQTQLIPVATLIGNVFVENVLQHTNSAPILTLETDGVAATIAVRDNCRTPPVRREHPIPGNRISGLAIVAAVCRTWGSAPTPSGKTVWAVVGPGDQL